MCRNMRTLFNFDPPATDAEIAAASLQFVRKLSGFQSPSLANAPAFERGTVEVARARAAERFGPRAGRPASGGPRNARALPAGRKARRAAR